LLATGISFSALNVPGFLREIFFKIMLHIQDIWVLLMASEQTATLSEFG